MSFTKDTSREKFTHLAHRLPANRYDLSAPLELLLSRLYRFGRNPQEKPSVLTRGRISRFMVLIGLLCLIDSNGLHDMKPDDLADRPCDALARRVQADPA